MVLSLEPSSDSILRHLSQVSVKTVRAAARRYRTMRSNETEPLRELSGLCALVLPQREGQLDLDQHRHVLSLFFSGGEPPEPHRLDGFLVEAVGGVQ